VIGMRNVWTGSYSRPDGKVVNGPSLSALLAKATPDAAKETDAKLAATVAAMTKLKQRGETVEAFDQMIADGNTEGNAVVQAGVDALTAQTKALENVVTDLKLPSVQFERSRSLEEPEEPDQVFQP
jgi:putative iron-regulated protein